MAKNIKRILIAITINVFWLIFSVEFASTFLFDWNIVDFTFTGKLLMMSPVVVLAGTIIYIITKWETKKK